MPVTHLHSFLVHPGKGIAIEKRAEIRGTNLQLSGKLFEMLEGVYLRAATECTTRISFTSDKQHNEARDLIVSYAHRPRSDSGEKLAKRLQSFTDGTPGMSLLFLVRGEEKGKTRTLISRFPADVGILADESSGGLNIEYLEKVFMRNSKKYKAAFYEDTSLKTGYWKGWVVDNQIQYGVVRTVSDYWVKDFLASDCLTTPSLGSSRLAKMFDQAIKQTSDTTIKDELASAAKLIPNQDGNKVSADLLAKQYGLSSAATESLKKEAKTEAIYREEFVLSRDAFSEILSFESVELNTGAILTAPTGQFDRVFTEEIVDGRNGLRIYRAEGMVADQRFRKAKP